MYDFFRSPPVRDMARLLAECTPGEKKAAITLARSQRVPDPTYDPTLFSKTLPFLNKLALVPPFTDFTTTALSMAGQSIIRCILSPILTGLIISLTLGAPWTDTDIRNTIDDSFNKELGACFTRRKPSTWNWTAILGDKEDPGNNIPHPDFPTLSPLQRRFQVALSTFRNRWASKTVYPHYTSRGISTETATYLLHRIKDKPIIGSRKTLHRKLDRNNVTSRDCVAHYLRTGNWIRGRTEMKQRWYPSGLAPRTYFSWGGMEIQASTYLRNFFNELADCFEPTHRLKRVQPDWLSLPDNYSDKAFFFFYDLTSFTSWFHEQVPFLESLSKYWSGYTMDCVSEGLTLTRVDVGDMIDGYIRWCNDFPEFTISQRLVGKDTVMANVRLHHLCAGFLGIPGNLITCTLPHGLAQATFYHDAHSLQVPGDDVGAAVKDECDMTDRGICARTLGSLQMDKVYESRQGSVYLKRMVVVNGRSVNLAQMLIYPLLPFILNTQDQTAMTAVSKMYRLPRTDQIISRACSVMATFVRDLWKISGGNIDDFSITCIIDLLQAIHQTLDLPHGPILQGRALGGDDERTSFKDISIKFPINEPQLFMVDPDRYFAERYVEVYHIHDLEDTIPLETVRGSIQEGDIITVRPHRGWKLLEDIGYVDRKLIAGRVKTVVGIDAKVAYLSLSKPEYIEIRALEEIPLRMLHTLDIIEGDEGTEFADPVIEDNRAGVVNEGLVSWHFRGYKDLDKPVMRAYECDELDYGDPEQAVDMGDSLEDEDQMTFSWDILLDLLT